MKQNRRKSYKFTATTTVDVDLSLFHFFTNKRQKMKKTENIIYNIKSNTTLYIPTQKRTNYCNLYTQWEKKEENLIMEIFHLIYIGSRQMGKPLCASW